MSQMQDFELLLAHRGTPPTTGLDFRSGVLDGRIAFTRASTATFVGSGGLIQTAASGAPRFGYDPASLTPLGLLVEEQRTNVSIQSSNPADAGWVTTLASKVTGQADPSGGTGACLITADGTNGSHYIQTPILSGTAGTNYQLSIFVKPGTVRYVQVRGNASVWGTNYANFDLTGSGAVTQTSTSAAIRAYPNGWYLLSYSDTAAATSSTGAVAIGFLVTGLETRAPSVTSSATFTVWGSQVEATTTGYPGPTSYIPTTAATVTRAADVAGMTGTNFSAWFNQAAGTFVAWVTPPGAYDQIGHFVAVNDGGAANYHLITRMNAAVSAAGRRWDGSTIVTSTVQSLLATAADNAGLAAKLGYAYATNDFAFVVDGNLIGTDNAGSLPALNQMSIGCFLASSQVNGHVGYINYYNTRLPNAQLQALTT